MVNPNKSLNTGLRVPADKRFLEIVQIYIRKLGIISGLSDLEARRLEMAAEEAFMNTLEHAYLMGVLVISLLKQRYLPQSSPYPSVMKDFPLTNHQRVTLHQELTLNLQNRVWGFV